jgi:hypothetical protein
MASWTLGDGYTLGDGMLLGGTSFNDVMRISSGGNAVLLSPLPGYYIPDLYVREIHLALDGTLYQYEFGNKLRWEIPVNNISPADAVLINMWWEENVEISFHNDMANTPSASYSVYCANQTRPLDPMFGVGWQIKYEGTIILQEF